MTRLVNCEDCGVTIVTESAWLMQCDECFESENAALAHAYLAKSPARWNREMWAYRIAFAIVGVLLIIVSFTDKKDTSKPATKIGTACLATLTSSDGC